MSKYSVLIAKSFKKMFYYKSQNLLGIVTSIIGIIMMQYFWKALYGSRTVVYDTSLNQMLLYSSMSWFLNLFNHEDVQNEILEDIKKGDVALKLVYPVNYIHYLFCKAIGYNLWIFLIKGVPIIVFVWLFLKPEFGVLELGLSELGLSEINLPQANLPEVNLSLEGILLFALSAILGNVLLCLVDLGLCLISFVWVEMSGLFVVRDVLTTIFSGLIIPTWFFPDFLQKVLNVLPFQYTFQVPLAILCGRIAVAEAGYYLAVQGIWLLGILIFMYLFWKWIVVRVESLGG